MMAQNVPETKKESDEISPWTGNDLVDQLEMKWAMSVLGNPIWTRAGRLLPPPQECQAEERGTPSHGNTKRQRNLIQIRNRKLEVWRKWVRPPTFQWVGAGSWGHRSTSIIRSQKWYLTRENQSWKWVSWKKKKNHKTLANLLFVLPIKDCDHHRDHRCPTSDWQQTSKKARRGMKLLWFPALHLLTHLPPTQSPPCPPCHHPPPPPLSFISSTPPPTPLNMFFTLWPDEIDPTHFGRFEPPLGIVLKDAASPVVKIYHQRRLGGYQPLSRDRGEPLMKSLFSSPHHYQYTLKLCSSAAW